MRYLMASLREETARLKEEGIGSSARVKSFMNL